ncbi:MAG: hypothetical protein DMF97_05450 [Acidobacteria bacterium]|nr:MAG: hypothetical protein DMF97_05450 [Acidobacteriota bacterium]
MPACFQLHQDHQQHEWPRRHEDTKKTAITQCRSVSTRGAKRRSHGRHAAVHESLTPHARFVHAPRAAVYWACYAGPRVETDRRPSTCAPNRAFFFVSSVKPG